MKKIPLFILIVCLLAAAVSAKWCYQESANVSNQTGIDGDCDLIYNGTHWDNGNFKVFAPASLCYDGNWSTGCDSNSNNAFGDIITTWIKPPFAIGGTRWRIDYPAHLDPNGEKNLSVGGDCWNASSTNMTLKRTSVNGGGVNLQGMFEYCWDGSTWVYMMTTDSYSHGGLEDAVIWLINCTPDWYCCGFAECNASDERACDTACDLNECGDSYSGDYSEFTPLGCDYCTPECACINLSEECIGGEYNCSEAADLNTCFAITGLPDDNVTCDPAPLSTNCSEEGHSEGYFTAYAIADLPRVGIDMVGETIHQSSIQVGLLILGLVILYILKKMKDAGLLK